jgi:hypothetical protein
MNALTICARHLPRICEVQPAHCHAVVQPTFLLPPTL